MHNSWLGRYNGRAEYSGDREINETSVSTPGNIVPKSRGLMYSRWITMKRASREAADGTTTTTTTTIWRRRRCTARNIARLSDVVARECIRRIEALPLSSLLPVGTSLLNFRRLRLSRSASQNSRSSTARDHATSNRGELARRFAARPLALSLSLARNDYSGAPPELITRPSV